MRAFWGVRLAALPGIQPAHIGMLAYWWCDLCFPVVRIPASLPCARSDKSLVAAVEELLHQGALAGWWLEEGSLSRRLRALS